MTNTINNSQIRIEKMGIESGEITEKLFSFKNESDEPIYDSAFKITDL